MARLVSLAALAVLMVVLGVTFYRVIAPFILPLFLAGVTAVICQPVFRSLIERCGGRVRLAAALTTVGVLVLSLVPLVLISLASLQLYGLARSKIASEDWKENMAALRQELQIDHLARRLLPYVSSAPLPDGEPSAADEAGRRRLDELQADMEARLKRGLESLTQKTIGVAGAAAASVPGAAVDILGNMVVFLVAGVMFVIALYYFFADGPAFLAASEQLVPVHVDYQRQLRMQFGSVVRAVTSATFLAALVQGFLCASALWFTGFGHFLLFFVLGTCAAMVPVIGTVPIWGPCVLWLGWQGNWGQALFLAAFGTLVIGTADNLIRTYVLQSNAKLHPLLAFISVLGGVQVMGLWGIFIGPIVASCLHALVTIFNAELKEFSKEKIAGAIDDRPGEIRSVLEVQPPAGTDESSRPADASDEPGPETAGSENAADSTAGRSGGKRSKRRRRQKR